MHEPGAIDTGNPDDGGTTENCGLDEAIPVTTSGDCPVLQMLLVTCAGERPHAMGKLRLVGVWICGGVSSFTRKKYGSMDAATGIVIAWSENSWCVVQFTKR